MKQFGFIGMGNMAGAMLNGMMEKYPKEEFIFSEIDTKKGTALAKEKGVEFAESNAACVRAAKYIILAVKPQYFPEIMAEIKGYIQKEQVIISIAAGVSLSDLKAYLGDDKRFVRAMPNTPALLKEGMTGVSYEEAVFTREEQEVIVGIFTSFGRVQKVEERLMNVVTCACGSSPAYVYMFIEALADGAVKYGLPRQTAYEMAAQTVLGAAKMVLETKGHPAVLKDMVCSPGGTTIAGVSALEEHGFRNAVIKATDACYHKAENM